MSSKVGKVSVRVLEDVVVETKKTVSIDLTFEAAQHLNWVLEGCGQGGFWRLPISLMDLSIALDDSNVFAKNPDKIISQDEDGVTNVEDEFSEF